MNKCKCNIIQEGKITSIQQFRELKKLLQELVLSEDITNIQVLKPYYVGHDKQGNEVKWFANKWYKCNNCGLIWEVVFPDFPAPGNVRKI